MMRQPSSSASSVRKPVSARSSTLSQSHSSTAHASPSTNPSSAASTPPNSARGRPSSSSNVANSSTLASSSHASSSSSSHASVAKHRRVDTLLIDSSVASAAVSANLHESGILVAAVETLADGVRCLCRTKNQIWAGGRKGQLIVYNMETLSVMQRRQVPTMDAILSMVALPDQVEQVWAGYSSGSIGVWNTTSVEPIALISGAHQGGVLTMCLVRGQVWTGGADFTIRCFDVGSRTSLMHMQHHKNWVRCLCFAEEEGMVWSGSDDRSIAVWSADSFELVSELKGHSDGVSALCYGGRGSGHVWSGSGDRSVRVWNTRTFKTIREHRMHSLRVQTLILAGSEIWSGAADRNVCIFAQSDTHMKKILAKEHDGWVGCLVYANERVWSAGADSVVRVWSAEGSKQAVVPVPPLALASLHNIPSSAASTPLPSRRDGVHVSSQTTVTLLSELPGSQKLPADTIRIEELEREVEKLKAENERMRNREFEELESVSSYQTTIENLQSEASQLRKELKQIRQSKSNILLQFSSLRDVVLKSASDSGMDIVGSEDDTEQIVKRLAGNYSCIQSLFRIFTEQPSAFVSGRDYPSSVHNEEELQQSVCSLARLGVSRLHHYQKIVRPHVSIVRDSETYSQTSFVGLEGIPPGPGSSVTSMSIENEDDVVFRPERPASVDSATGSLIETADRLAEAYQEVSKLRGTVRDMCRLIDSSRMKFGVVNPSFDGHDHELLADFEEQCEDTAELRDRLSSTYQHLDSALSTKVSDLSNAVAVARRSDAHSVPPHEHENVSNLLAGVERLVDEALADELSRRPGSHGRVSMSAASDGAQDRNVDSRALDRGTEHDSVRDSDVEEYDVVRKVSYVISRLQARDAMLQELQSSLETWNEFAQPHVGPSGNMGGNDLNRTVVSVIRDGSSHLQSALETWDQETSRLSSLVVDLARSVGLSDSDIDAVHTHALGTIAFMSGILGLVKVRVAAVQESAQVTAQMSLMQSHLDTILQKLNSAPVPSIVPLPVATGDTIDGPVSTSTLPVAVQTDIPCLSDAETQESAIPIVMSEVSTITDAGADFMDAFSQAGSLPLMVDSASDVIILIDHVETDTQTDRQIRASVCEIDTQVSVFVQESSSQSHDPLPLSTSEVEIQTEHFQMADADLQVVIDSIDCHVQTMPELLPLQENASSQADVSVEDTSSQTAAALSVAVVDMDSQAVFDVCEAQSQTIPPVSVDDEIVPLVADVQRGNASVALPDSTTSEEDVEDSALLPLVIPVLRKESSVVMNASGSMTAGTLRLLLHELRHHLSIVDSEDERTSDRYIDLMEALLPACEKGVQPLGDDAFVSPVHRAMAWKAYTSSHIVFCRAHRANPTTLEIALPPIEPCVLDEEARDAMLTETDALDSLQGEWHECRDGLEWFEAVGEVVQRIEHISHSIVSTIEEETCQQLQTELSAVLDREPHCVCIWLAYGIAQARIAQANTALSGIQSMLEQKQKPTIQRSFDVLASVLRRIWDESGRSMRSAILFFGPVESEIRDSLRQYDEQSGSVGSEEAFQAFSAVYRPILDAMVDSPEAVMALLQELGPSTLSSIANSQPGSIAAIDWADVPSSSRLVFDAIHNQF